jgi:hypothetical protein
MAHNSNAWASRQEMDTIELLGLTEDSHMQSPKSKVRGAKAWNLPQPTGTYRRVLNAKTQRRKAQDFLAGIFCGRKIEAILHAT